MSFKLREDLVRQGQNEFHRFLEIPVDFDSPVIPGDNDFAAKTAIVNYLRRTGISGGLDWRVRKVLVDHNDNEVLHTDNPKHFRIYYRVNIVDDVRNRMRNSAS